MPDPAWPASPPEANYLRLVGSGAAGTGTTLASAAAWQALAVSNEVAAAVSTLNTAVTAVNFEGLGGTASATTATGLNASLHLLAGWAQEKSPIAASAVAAYDAAVSSMIPAEVSLANRAEQAADVAMNPLVLGALTPVIVALDLEYFGEHWPHNAAAGAAYGSALTALLPALAVPPPLAPPSPAAPVAAAAAVAETAAQTAAGGAMKQSGEAAKLAGEGAAAPAQAVGQAGQLASTMTQPLQSAAQPLMGMFQVPLQAFQNLSSLSQSMSAQVGAHSEPAVSAEAQVSTAMLAPSGAPGIGIGGTGSGPVGLGSAGVGAGTGSVPGPGLTNYTRPNSTFGPENSGRPISLRPGLLSSSELRGPVTSAPWPPAGGPIPVAPAQAGMLGQGKADTGKDDGARARIVVAGDQRIGSPDR